MSCNTEGVTTNVGTDVVEDEIDNMVFEISDDDMIQADHSTYNELGEENEDETEVDINDINFDEEMEDDEAVNISIGVVSDAVATASDQCSRESGFDFSAGNMWIYPTNYPVREYQYNIVQKALYKNTLVVLPTGLGKTFIAAVVMYNFFRWYPQGKIVFMAPTKPLVAQQIKACYNIMGIPKADTVEMTGTLPPAIRQKVWREKRVVFLTPQVMTNDLSRGSLTADSIKCLVLDEAHKALGNHAYCQVVRELVKFTRDFRILALSATPGSDLKAVQQVMNNLLISHIELRSEECKDICPYTHERKVEKIVVPLGEELSDVKMKYSQIITCVVQRLIRNRVLYNKEATKLSKFMLLKARIEFRQNPPQNLQQAQFGNIEADFAMAISLYHGFELLQLHGLRSLYNFLTGIITGEKGYGRTRSELMRNTDFNDVMEVLRQKFLVSGAASGDSKIVVGHPKMLRLEEIVVDHFKSFQKSEWEETRVMIFSQYRDSVQEINSILNQHQPLIKAMPFIGQSSGKTKKGYTQKEQLMVMRNFREGGYNTLVSTCVGEEGLDIGDVDLIVCFDAHKSPIRLVQRMGRTGRKRQGRIVMLVTQGKEEQIYNQSLYSKKTIHKAISNETKSLHFYPNNPRMIPLSINPQCHKMFITLATDSARKKASTSKRSKSLVERKSRKISDIFGNQGKRKIEEEHLTLAEYDEIRNEFAEVSSIAKYLPQPKCITLASHTENLCDQLMVASSQQIDFAEWMPWQNRLQNTHTIGHSVQSIHLVKDSEFIQLQQCIGKEDDQYGSEMNNILNKKETDNTTEQSDRQSSIRSFLTNVQGTSEAENTNRLYSESNMKKLNVELCDHGQHKKKVSRNRKKLTNTNKNSIFVADETETVLIDSDSSINEKLGGVTETVINSKQKVSKLFTELNDHSHKSNTQNSGSVKKRFSKGAKGNSLKTHSLGGKHAGKKKAESVKKNKCPEVGRRFQSERTKLKRKSVLDLMESDSYNILSAEDNDDFETDYPLSKRNENCSTNFGKINNANKEMVNNSDAAVNCASSDENIDIGDNRIGNIEFSHVDQSCEINSPKQVPEHNISNVNVRQIADNWNREAFHIPQPPPVSSVKELFQGLTSMKDFANLDLEELMEQLKGSEKDVCRAAASQHNVLMSVEKRSDLKFVSINPAIRNDTSLKTSLTNIGTDAGECVMESMRSCGDELSPLGARESLNSCSENHAASAKKVEPAISSSPLFKSFVSNSVQINKQSIVPKMDSYKKPCPPRNQEIVKVFDTANHSSPKDSKHDKSSSKTSPHHIELKFSSTITDKTSSSTENMNHTKLSDSFLAMLDETDMDIDVSMKQMNTSKFHESFVTFSQAMACLQNSSSEEAVNISTPHVSPKRCDTFFERCGLKDPSSDTKMGSAEINQLHQTDLRSCDKKPEFATVSLNHVSPSVTSSVFATKISSETSNTHPTHDDKNQQIEDVYTRIKQKTDYLSSSLPKVCIDTPGPTSAYNHDLPQFDLGFDLDDDDDDNDIISSSQTKNMSQDTVFGLKTVTASKLQSPDAATFSFFTGNKNPDSINNESNTQGLPLYVHADTYKPVITNFDLNLLSDEDNDMDYSENIDDSLQHHLCVSGEDTANQQKEEILFKNTVDALPPKLEMKKYFEKHDRVSQDDDKNTMGFDTSILLEESGSNEAVSLYSSPKKQKLPFGIFSKVLEKGCKDTISVGMSSAGDGEFLNELSSGMSTKARAEKLRLDKHQQHFNESVYQINNSKIMAAGDDTISEHHRESCKRSLHEDSKNLNNFGEAGEFVKQVSENMKSQIKKISSLDHQPGIRSVYTLKETSLSHDAKTEHDSIKVVKASTPLRKSPGENHINKAVLSGDKSIQELTPIKAQNNESCCDSDDSYIIRRRKRIKILDDSSDYDAREETFHLNTSSIRKDKISLTQSSLNILQGVGKSISDDTKQSSISDVCDDDGDDFKDTDNVIFQPKQVISNNKIQLKKSNMLTEFIVKEAEVSGDDVSSDEMEEKDDFYESSFIDNNTEVTQTQNADMKAIYLKSIKSPVLDGIASRYKMQYNTKRRQDMSIFSQTLPEDHGMSEYEEDSFCVGSDVEDSCLEEESQLLKHKQQKLSKPGPRKNKKARKYKKVMPNSSSDEENGAGIQMTQEFSIHPCKFGRKVLASSSEDEVVKRSSSFLNKTESSNTESKICKIFPQENRCDTVMSERLSLPGITDERQTSQENMEHEKPSESCHQGLKSCQSVASDVGNFDWLADIDWFDDFDVSKENRKCGSKHSLTSNLSKDNLKADTYGTEKKFLSLKNIKSSVCDNKTKEKDFPPQDSSLNNIKSKIYTDYKLQEQNLSKGSSSASVASRSVAYRPLSDNSKNVGGVLSQCDDRLEIHKEESLKEDVHLRHCVTPVSYTDVDSTASVSRHTCLIAEDLLKNSQLNQNCSKSMVAMTKEERIRRQKEKQEAYRKKLKQVQQITDSTRSPDTCIVGASNLNLEIDSVKATTDLPSEAYDQTSRDIADSSVQGQPSTVSTKIMETERSGHQLQILVDSREISGAQEVISTLRLKYCITVTARQLTSCDYILSNHLAADRVQLSTFSNSSHRSKLSSRLCEMQALYQRCALIVETDRVKAGQEKSKKPVHRTKYLDTTLSYLAQSNVKVYFTDSAEETANLLADLCHIEGVKGRALNVPAQLSSAKEEMFSFVLAMPGVTVPQAINLAYRFRSIVELFSSPASVIQERGCMTYNSAQALCKSLHHQFDLHMMSSLKS